LALGFGCTDHDWPVILSETALRDAEITNMPFWTALTGALLCCPSLMWLVPMATMSKNARRKNPSISFCIHFDETNY
jgi:hypothetical protein